MQPDENERANRADDSHSEEPATDRLVDTGGWDEYFVEEVLAVEPTETTAGVVLTRHDLDEHNGTFMLGIHEYYPPEDDVEGESVYVHGERALFELFASLSQIVSDRYDRRPWADE